MIKRKNEDKGSVKLTFSVCSDDPVSVVGDFNGWDPDANPLRPRSNGHRSATIAVPLDAQFRFRYLADGGRWFDDPDADWYEPDQFGDQHGVIVARQA